MRARSVRRLVFDLDDNLLAIPRTHPDAAVLRPRAKVVRRMLDVADVIWLSTHGAGRTARGDPPRCGGVGEWAG